MKLTRIALLCLIVLRIGALSSAAQTPNSKTPVPQPEAIEQAEKLIQELYGEAYSQAATNSEKQELAKEILEAADRMTSDPAGRFVLLRTARKTACLACDCAASMSIAEKTCCLFAVDLLDTKLETIRLLGQAATSREEYDAVAKLAEEVAGQAEAAGSYLRADDLLELAVAAGRRARDYDLVRRVVDRQAELEDLTSLDRQYQKALDTLKDKPTDPAANLVAGRYLCVFRDNWQQGIPMLSLGSDKALAALARRELADPEDPDEWIAIGDAWNEQAQSNDAMAKAAFLRRAGYWYEQAVRQTTGLERLKAEQRAGAIAAVLKADQERQTSDARTTGKKLSPPKFWLGYHLADSTPETIGRIGAFGNVVFVGNWRDQGEAVIEAARKKRQRVVLCFYAKMLAEAEQQGIALARENADVIQAMCWNNPYHEHSSANEIAQFGRTLKQAAPGVQFWCRFLDYPQGKRQTPPVPPEVDVLIVAHYYASTPAELQEKASGCYPGWLERAAGRPVLLLWTAYDKKAPGLIPRCHPGTIPMCGQIARRYGLSGLILGHYGTIKNCVGLETNPAMVEQIKRVGRSFGVQ